jgi:F0F1-type ATP synthase delta subunit
MFLQVTRKRTDMDEDMKSKVDEFNDMVVAHYDDRATVMSGYKLSKSEIDDIKSLIPALKDVRIENEVDSRIFSGLIIKVGTRLLDLTLNGALQNLRKTMYESN